MKYFGIMFLFLSVSLIGFEFGRRYLDLLDDIKRTEKLLKIIVLFIENENITVPEILKKCGTYGDEKTKKFVSLLLENKFTNIYENSLKSGFCIQKEAEIILEDAFSVFGKFSAKEQTEELKLCRKRLENLYEAYEEPFKSKSKIFKYSGIFSGIFISILLI